MWMNFSGRPARRAQPCWCMTHDMSGETMYSAPAWWWSSTLSWPIFADTGSSKTEKVPPKPQHSSGRCGCTNSIPFTADSSRAGLLKAGSTISEALASRRPRKVAQPMCRPTLCGNSAHGNSRTPRTSCRNSTSSRVLRRTACTAGVCSIAVIWSRTWWAQLPEGVTMWS